MYLSSILFFTNRSFLNIHNWIILEQKHIYFFTKFFTNHGLIRVRIVCALKKKLNLICKVKGLFS